MSLQMSLTFISVIWYHNGKVSASLTVQKKKTTHSPKVTPAFQARSMGTMGSPPIIGMGPPSMLKGRIGGPVIGLPGRQPFTQSPLLQWIPPRDPGYTVDHFDYLAMKKHYQDAAYSVHNGLVGHVTVKLIEIGKGGKLSSVRVRELANTNAID
jgi:hypothetical protein